MGKMDDAKKVGGGASIGAGAGATIGFLIGGPIGAGIGAAVGIAGAVITANELKKSKISKK